jgi:Histone-like transcription factor (CBF/NF-Y) and archaeal histone
VVYIKWPPALVKRDDFCQSQLQLLTLLFFVLNATSMAEGSNEGAAGTSGQWKSRFPVARIKKIMQADEDVGKVAQVTPVAICTFPISLD